VVAENNRREGLGTIIDEALTVARKKEATATLFNNSYPPWTSFFLLTALTCHDFMPLNRLLFAYGIEFAHFRTYCIVTSLFKLANEQLDLPNFTSLLGRLT
jgi:hypothetical protein